MRADAFHDAPKAKPVASTDFDRPVFALLGLPFDATDLRRAVGRIKSAAANKERCFFSTPNLNFVVGCRSDPGFRDSVLCSDLSVPDGMPLIWVARLLGLPISDRVAGSNLLEDLQLADGPFVTTYLLGGPDGAAEQACNAINALGTGIECVGYHSPGFGSVEQMSQPAVIDAINRSEAQFLILALGARKGQEWIMRNLSFLKTPVIGYLGAVINFAAGNIARAPLSWQRLGVEWVWRIRQEPGLWKRYASDGLVGLGLFVTEVLPTLFDLRLRAPSQTELAAARVDVTNRGDDKVISMSGSWSHGNMGALRSAFRNATTTTADVTLDVAHLGFFDNACVGLLMLLCGHQRKIARRFRVINVSAATRRRLRRHGAAYLLGDGQPRARATSAVPSSLTN